MKTGIISSKLGVFPILLSLLFLTGCPLIAGTIDSVRRVGLTEGSRVSLLPPAVSQFNDAVGWGDITKILSLATDSYRTELRDQLLREKGKVKVIESVVDLSEFEDNANVANVFVTIKSYTVPFYVAETSKQQQHWEFTLSGGWKIAKIEPYKN